MVGVMRCYRRQLGKHNPLGRPDFSSAREDKLRPKLQAWTSAHLSERKPPKQFSGVRVLAPVRLDPTKGHTTLRARKKKRAG